MTIIPLLRDTKRGRDGTQMMVALAIWTLSYIYIFIYSLLCARHWDIVVKRNIFAPLKKNIVW